MYQHCIWSLLLIPFLVESTLAGTFSIGPAAEQQCKRVYKKYCSPGRVCAIQHYHKPFNISVPVCLPEYLVRTEKPPCHQSMDYGKCGARFIRWYYHRGDSVCKWFHYGGCEGNQNNFKTRDLCESTCKRNLPATHNSARHKGNSIALPVKSTVVISDPVFLPKQADQSSNPLTVRSNNILKLDKERRRQRQSRRDKRRLKLIRRRSKFSRRKRRREGKIRKKRRKGKRNKKRRKHQKHPKRRKNKNKKKRRKSEKSHKKGKSDDAYIEQVTEDIKKSVALSEISDNTRTNKIAPRKVLTVKPEEPKEER